MPKLFTLLKKKLLKAFSLKMISKEFRNESLNALHHNSNWTYKDAVQFLTYHTCSTISSKRWSKVSGLSIFIVFFHYCRRTQHWILEKRHGISFSMKVNISWVRTIIFIFKVLIHKRIVLSKDLTRSTTKKL